jgi:hypothetical protein
MPEFPLMLKLLLTLRSASEQVDVGDRHLLGRGDPPLAVQTEQKTTLNIYHSKCQNLCKLSSGGEDPFVHPSVFLNSR